MSSSSVQDARLDLHPSEWVLMERALFVAVAVGIWVWILRTLWHSYTMFVRSPPPAETVDAEPAPRARRRAKE